MGVSQLDDPAASTSKLEDADLVPCSEGAAPGPSRTSDPNASGVSSGTVHASAVAFRLRLDLC